MLKRIILSVIVFTGLFLLVPIRAQNTLNGTHRIGQLIEEGHFDDADKLLTDDLRYWFDKRNGDTLLTYIRLKGLILKHQKRTIREALSELENFVYQFVSHKLEDSIITSAYLDLANFASDHNETAIAYRNGLRALSHARKIAGDSLPFMATCQYNLGVYAFRMGNVQKAIHHYRITIEERSKLKDIPLQKIYLTQSALANIYWYELKYDSSEYYFNKALQTVGQMPQVPLNKYFRKALLNNGLMVISKENGRMDQSIELGYQVIADYRSFIENAPDDKIKINEAKQGMYEAMDNLGVAYESIGNYKRGEAIKLYSQQQKQKDFKPGFEGIYISDILIGQSYTGQKKYEKAIKYLYSGINGLKQDANDHTLWFGDAYKALASVYQVTDTAKTLMAFDSASYYYELAYGNGMDNTYSEFLREKGLFLAGQGNYKKARQTYQKIKEYLDKNSNSNFIEYYHYYHDLAKLNFNSKRYKDAILSGDEALSHIDKQYRSHKSGRSALDSFKTEFYKPEIILIKARVLYEMTPSHDSFFLAKLYHSLDTALSIVEHRRTLLEEVENVNIMLEDNGDLFDFTSKILLELAEKDHSDTYIQKFIDVRENAVFNRIRSRIEQQKAVRFSGVPDSVLKKELRIKKALVSNKAGGLDADLSSWQTAIRAWENFLKDLRDKYPAYYELKYIRPASTLPQISNLIPSNKTLIRYYLIENRLVVAVADAGKVQLLNLPRNNLDSLVRQLTQAQLKEKEFVTTLHQIYQIIWEPVSHLINTNGVIIVPDGILYDINLEMLPYQPCNSYEELARVCLLNKYSFSELYSIRMLETRKNTDEKFKSYVGFIPGFSDDSKKEYVRSLSDSIYLDNNYLRLLPQPNNEKLAKRLRQHLGGSLYSSGASTIETFLKEADNHKLVHIATHAEFNNIMPEQSGLYFSKTKNGENFFSVNNIYESVINSDLTILTACESGRSGYQDGEGLISLSHAFNYAGSANILTAIWKIDEKATAQITGEFVEGLIRGLPTDEALREAKFAYLKGAEGRMLAPAYWSGLILMGKPAYIRLQRASNSGGRYLKWILICSATILLSVFLYKQKNYIHRKP